MQVKALAGCVVLALGAAFALGASHALAEDEAVVIETEGRRELIVPPQAMQIGPRAAADGTLGRIERAWSQPGTYAVDIEVSSSAPLPAATLAFVDGDGRTLGTIDLAGSLGVRRFDSPEYADGIITVELRGDSFPADATVSLVGRIRPSGAPQPLSVWPRGTAPQFEPVATLTDDTALRVATKAVARLKIGNTDNSSVPCTGFLVGRQMLITNAHCVSKQAQCDRTWVYFNYLDGTLPASTSVHCKAYVAGQAPAEESLDYALLELQQPSGDAQGFLHLGTSPPNAGVALRVPQHPGGKPMQVARQECASDLNPMKGRADDTDFGHSCDTQGGSSGSPLLDSANRVVGLHHWGRDGGYDKNRAVRIELIVADLRRRAVLPAEQEEGQ